MNVEKILRDYTAGKISLEEANQKLKDEGCNFHLNPERNVITDAERDSYGLLDTGTGSLIKVKITNGELENAVNEQNPDGTYNMLAYVLFNGKKYTVHGKKLVE